MFVWRFLWRSSLAEIPPRESKRLSAPLWRAWACACGTTMDTDTCADVSHALDPILDEADPIEQSYYLEVGSPGLGRKLTRPEHYEAVRGQKVSVRLYRANENGVKEFSGLLTSREGNTITLEGPAGPMQFELSAVSTVRLCDDEDLFD